MMEFIKMFSFITFVVCTILWMMLSVCPSVPKEPELVATRDGCNVYRYYDKGNKIYFNTCGGVE